MPTIMAHHRKARGLDILLYRPTDILNTIACPRRRDTTVECIFRDLEQALHLLRNLPNRDSNRRVGMPAIIAGGEVKCDDIALVQYALAWYAMNYFCVYRRTKRLCVTVIAQRARFRAMTP